MAKKSIKKISDKLNKVNETFSVNIYDNGYMLEISGKDNEGEWANAKLMVSTVEELMALVKEATELDRDD
jgi:hypothetical protein